MKKAEIIPFLKIILFFLVFFNLIRLVFFYSYVDQSTTLNAIKVLYYGFKFDAAALAYTLFLPVLSSRVFNLSLSIKNKVASRFLAIAINLMFILPLILCLADYIYYPNSSKKLGYEAFVYLDGSVFKIAYGAFLAKPMLFAFAIPALIVLIYISIRLVTDWLNSIRLADKNSTIKIYLARLFVVFIVLVLSLRGGAQRVPLRVGDSFLTDSININNSILNPVFVVFRTIGQSRKVNYINYEEAKNKIAELLKIKSEDLVEGATYPIYRKTDFSTNPPFERKKYNVVVFLLESWTSRYFFKGAEEFRQVTPEFNKLIQEGVWFPRFFASGFRTTSGLYSVLTAQPDQVGVPVMRRQELSNNFASFSRLLKQQGYTNMFFNGGKLDFDNLHNMLKFEMFDSIVGENDYGPSVSRSVMGVDDGPVYERLLKTLTITKGPFFAYVLSGTTHAPYALPKDFPQLIADESVQNIKYLNTLRYADHVIVDFINKAKNKDFFKDTIFVFTGDHTVHNGLDAYENQKVPLLIYAPAIVKPQIRRTVATQTDILPTLADMLNLPVHASLGKNLWNYSDTDGVGYFINGLEIGYVDNNYFILRSPDQDKFILYKHADAVEKIETLDKDQLQELMKKPLYFYQFSNDILTDNHIYINKSK